MFMVDFFLNKESFLHLYIYIYHIYTITYYIPACKKLTSYKRSEFFNITVTCVCHANESYHVEYLFRYHIQFLK